jgi:Sel1 repeat
MPNLRGRSAMIPPRATTTSSPVLALPLCLTVALAGFVLFDRVGEGPNLPASVLGAALALAVFAFVMMRRVRASGRRLSIEYAPRPVHYVQLMMHSSVYAYWGWYWREVYHDVPLILLQIVFAFALDMLVCWTRRDKWIAGFGPIPIVLSTNLFLWFKDDWFYLQFVLIATGILGKEFIRWKREGRLTHIFNPSAFSLFVFSVVLIATKSTDKTWGMEIATSIHRPPHIYLEIFLLGLIVQALFRVTLVTLSAASSLWLINLWYTHSTGMYHFVDSNIPVAVFLGLHLLVTDPATSPRTNLGKIIFGSLYGICVFGMYGLLLLIGAPEFYDKLLCVPPLNLTVKLLDRFSLAVADRWKRWVPALESAMHSPALNGFLKPKPVNYVFMSVWIAVFAGMMSTSFLTKGKDHPGGDPAFWARACQQHGSGLACDTWLRTLNGACQSDSASHCMKLAAALQSGVVPVRDPSLLGVTYGHACDLGVSAACESLLTYVKSGGSDMLSRSCDRGDGASCFILGSLYSGGKGVTQDPTLAFEFFTKSCSTNWWRGCGRLGVSYLVGQGVFADPALALKNFEKGCRGENAASCVQGAQLYAEGPINLRNRELAQTRLSRACSLGLQTACRQIPGLAQTSLLQ